MIHSNALQRLRRAASRYVERRSARRTALAVREHETGPAARAGLPDRADLRSVGLGGQTTGSGAS